LGRHVPGRMVMLGRQAECMGYSRAAGPTRTYFAADVPKGIEGDRDYHIGQGKDGKYFWYFYPKCLAELEALQPWLVPPKKHTPVYVGERLSKGGNKRLVVVRCIGKGSTDPEQLRFSFDWDVIQPATFGNESRVVRSEHGLAQIANVVYSHRFEAQIGQSDPTDGSHFTIDLTANGAPLRVDGWLMDDDTLRIVEQ